jgi:hypothetical protein
MQYTTSTRLPQCFVDNCQIFSGTWKLGSPLCVVSRVSGTDAKSFHAISTCWRHIAPGYLHLPSPSRRADRRFVGQPLSLRPLQRPVVCLRPRLTTLLSCAEAPVRTSRAKYRSAVGLERCCWLRIPVMLFDAPDGLRVSDANYDVRIAEMKSSRPVIRETAGPHASRPPLEPALVT